MPVLIHNTLYRSFFSRDFGAGRKIRDQLSPKLLFLFQSCETPASFVKSSINCHNSALDQYDNLTIDSSGNPTSGPPKRSCYSGTSRNLRKWSISTKTIFHKIQTLIIRYSSESVCLDNKQCVILYANRHIHQWLYFRRH